MSTRNDLLEKILIATASGSSSTGIVTETHDGIITSDEAWGTDAVHLITSDLTIAATVTIAAGVKVEIAEGVTITIGSTTTTGNLVTEGTPTSPIIIEAQDSSPVVFVGAYYRGGCILRNTELRKPLVIPDFN